MKTFSLLLALLILTTQPSVSLAVQNETTQDRTVAGFIYGFANWGGSPQMGNQAYDYFAVTIVPSLQDEPSSAMIVVFPPTLNRNILNYDITNSIVIETSQLTKITDQQWLKALSQRHSLNSRTPWTAYSYTGTKLPLIEKTR